MKMGPKSPLCESHYTLHLPTLTEYRGTPRYPVNVGINEPDTSLKTSQIYECGGMIDLSPAV